MEAELARVRLQSHRALAVFLVVWSAIGLVLFSQN